MTGLQVFKNSEFGELGILVIDGKEYFPATECARMLGYSNPWDAIARHCKPEGVAKHEGVSTTTNQHGATTEQVVEKTYINEGNLYRLIARSKLPGAERFESWIFDEVLPTIRRHGAYLTPERLEEVLLNPDTIIRLATDLKAEREAKAALAAKVEKDKPKVLFAESVSASDSTVLVRELAKVLKQNGIDTGEKRLFEWLRQNGYLISKEGSDYNTPTQRSMEMGLFEVQRTTITLADGRIKVKTTPKVTGKGQIYFVNKLKQAS